MTKKRGGKRAGSGRKRLPPTRVLSVRVRVSWYDECMAAVKAKVNELKKV